MNSILDIQTNEAIGERGLINIHLPEGDGPFKFILGIHGERAYFKLKMQEKGAI